MARSDKNTDLAENCKSETNGAGLDQVGWPWCASPPLMQPSGMRDAVIDFEGLTASGVKAHSPRNGNGKSHEIHAPDHNDRSVSTPAPGATHYAVGRIESDLVECIEELGKANEELNCQAKGLKLRYEQQLAQLAEGIKTTEAMCQTLAQELQDSLRSMRDHSQRLMQSNAWKLDEDSRRSVKHLAEASEQVERIARDLLRYGQLSHSKVIQNAQEFAVSDPAPEVASAPRRNGK